MISNEKTVFILGAGFTKAFYPDAPLVVDDYGSEEIAEKIKHLKHASRVLDWERSREPGGLLNIERFMTRLDAKMPYDFEQNADEELSILFSEVKKAFIKRIENAKKKSEYQADLDSFAQYCVDNRVICITTNYDDCLDEALYRVSGALELGPPSLETLYWHPDGGYGFFCRPSACTIQDTDIYMDVDVTMHLLKLHGSINWRPRRGYRQPYTVDAIVHHEPWFQEENVFTILNKELVSMHLEPESFIVPPVLFKSAIIEQPILRLVWQQAYKALFEATYVVFVGYSLPITDIAVSILFFESLYSLPRRNINVVNLAYTKADKHIIRNSYEAVFGRMPYKIYKFDGALQWSRELVA